MSNEIRILIADDHPLFRKGLLQLITAETDLSVVGEADDGAMACEQIKNLRPDLVILDISMPRMDGFAVARELRAAGLDVPIIFLTAYKDEDLFNESIELGALGYVLKSSALSDILDSIKAVIAGEYYISPALSTFLVARKKQADTPLNRLRDLTPSELRVLKLIAQARTNKEIAGELFISHRTVENHRANICQKLDLHGTNALTRFALDHKTKLQ